MRASQGVASLQPIALPGHTSIAGIHALETASPQLAQARCVVGAKRAGCPQDGSPDDRLDLAASLVDLHVQLPAIAPGPGPMIHAMKADSHACGDHLSELSRPEVARLADAAGKYEELGTKTPFHELGERHLEVRLVPIIETEAYLRQMGHALEKLDEEVSRKPVLELVGRNGAWGLSKPMKIEDQEVLHVDRALPCVR